MLQSRSQPAETAPNHYAGRRSATAESRGCAIPNDRFWLRWRRNRDGASDTPGAAPRSLQRLLKEVEKAAQVRRSGLDQVLAELQAHREATTDSDLRSALAWLCNTVTRFLHNPTAPHARQMTIAADAVKRVPAD